MMNETLGMTWAHQGDTKTVLTSVLSADVAATINSGGYCVRLYHYDADSAGVHLKPHASIILSADAALRLADYINARRETLETAVNDEKESE